VIEEDRNILHKYMSEVEKQDLKINVGKRKTMVAAQTIYDYDNGK